MSEAKSGERKASSAPPALGAVLVTGGAGLLGRHLARELARRGHRVRVLDRSPAQAPADRIEFVHGDVTSYEDVRKACDGIDTIFHTAAVFDFSRFPSPAARARSYAVNVDGVRQMLRAARECRVSRLVHTSTNNVTLDGPVIDGDETRPYAKNVRDLYTETKIEGEKLVVAANGEDGLLTCVIRPGGIYGPGDRLMIPRVVDELLSHRYVAILGDGRALADNVHVANLADAMIEAARHLAPGSPVPGQVYFVSDGAPMNYFDFFRPVVEALGYRHPRLRIPGRPVELLCAGLEWIHGRLGGPAPPMTSLEVRKIYVSHYNRIDKARRDFGWTPKVTVEQAMQECIDRAKELVARREVVDRPHWGWWVSILSGMTLLGMLTLSGDAHRWWSETVTTWTPRWLLAGIFVWAVLLHVYKGMKAVRLAERAGLRRTSLAWGWQTFALGFASLGLLEKRIERQGSDAD